MQAASSQQSCVGSLGTQGMGKVENFYPMNILTGLFHTALDSIKSTTVNVCQIVIIFKRK